LLAPEGAIPLCDGRDRRFTMPKVRGVFVGGLSGDPAARERQLANLRRGGPVQPGNANRLVHGGWSRALVADVSDEVAELMAALGDVAPVRDYDGRLPAADLIAVERAARLLRRYRALDAWLDLHGVIDDKTGAEKPAARLAHDVGESLGRALEALGMDPRSRAKLGLDLVRRDAELTHSGPLPSDRTFLTDPAVKAAHRRLVDAAARARAASAAHAGKEQLNQLDPGGQDE
jgi:hypothetical protein